MGAFLVIALLAVPLAELYVILQVADGIGVLNTLALLILVSVAGAALLKREGMATWKRLQEQIQAGKVPTKEVTDGALILFGGALLLTPGFLTDIVGLLFLFPPTRAALKGVFRKSFGSWAVKRHPAGYAGYKVYDATATRSRRSGTNPPLAESAIDPDPPGGVEGDSPDRG